MALQLASIGLASSGLASTGLASPGVIWEHTQHTVDVVISEEHKLVYVDNVKAGSTTIRVALQQVLNASWNHHSCCSAQISEDEQTERGCQVNHFPTEQFNGGSRTTTRCLNATHDDYFIFSFVRHPVSKFESGVRQAWSQNSGLSSLTADALLEKQLGQFEDGVSTDWINEHFQPNTYRLTGFTHQQEEPVRLDYVGRLEVFDADLGHAADLYDNTTALSTPCAAAHAASASNSGTAPKCGLRLLYEHLQGASEKANSRAEVDASVLSEHGIARLCASDVYVGSATPSSAPLASALGKYVCAEPQASRAATVSMRVGGDPHPGGPGASTAGPKAREPRAASDHVGTLLPSDSWWFAPVSTPGSTA